MQQIRIIAGLAVTLLAGCAMPRVSVPSAAAALGTLAQGKRIPIRAFSVQSSDKPYETKSDMRFLSGDSRGILFPKQARQFLAQDLRDYMDSRFRIDPGASPVVTLDLEQAQSYFTMHSSGANWIPFVGVVTSVADGFQQVPVVFAVEVKADVSGVTTLVPQIDVFIRNTQHVTGWSGTPSRHMEIYRTQIAAVRKQLFDQLDSQLLSLWEHGQFVGNDRANHPRTAAALASALAHLDSELADGTISQLEHDKSVEALEAKYENVTQTGLRASP